MKRSQLFTKTRKDVPADETSKNAQLLIQGGYIHKEMAGVYDYLPLGLMTLNNIMAVIREEMNSVGGQEVFLSALQPKENWVASGRWNDDIVDVWFKTHLHSGEAFHSGTELGLGNTHEEALTALMKNFVSSYKDLPSYPYQFQTKFRNELRSKSGIMRTREFIMKDLYSFSRNQKSHDEFYERMQQAYLKIYERLGIGDITYVTFASGGSFSKFSHEFQTLTDVGEDTIYVHEGSKLAINKEVYTDEVLADLGLDKSELTERKAVEVGNIFTLGTKYSEALELLYTDEDGAQKPVFMGSYGIGPGRVMGTIAEHFSDDKGLAWPEEVAPFKVYLAPLSIDGEVKSEADNLYDELQAKGISVIYDDRDARAGQKFADADLLGIPYRVVVSQKTLQNSTYEIKHRKSDDVELITREELVKRLV